MAVSCKPNLLGSASITYTFKYGLHIIQINVKGHIKYVKQGYALTNSKPNLG